MGSWCGDGGDPLPTAEGQGRRGSKVGRGPQTSGGIWEPADVGENPGGKPLWRGALRPGSPASDVEADDGARRAAAFLGPFADAEGYRAAVALSKGEVV